MTIVTQGTTPTVQVIIDQIVIRLQLLPSLLSQIQLLPIVTITSYCKNLILKLDRLVPQISTFIHFVEIYQLVALDIELKNLLVEALTPTSSQNVDIFAFRHRSSIRKREK